MGGNKGSSSGVGVATQIPMAKMVGKMHMVTEKGKEKIVECREDREYGDWTLVQRRKPRVQQGQQLNHGGPHGGNQGGRQQDGRQQEGGGLGGGQLLVNAQDNVMRFTALGGTDGKHSGWESKGGGNKHGVVHKKRPGPSQVAEKSHGSRSSESAIVCWQGKEGQLGIRGEKEGGVRDSLELPLASLINDSMRKRRRGSTSDNCGGDASPKGKC